MIFGVVVYILLFVLCLVFSVMTEYLLKERDLRELINIRLGELHKQKFSLENRLLQINKKLNKLSLKQYVNIKKLNLLDEKKLRFSNSLTKVEKEIDYYLKVKFIVCETNKVSKNKE